MSLQINAIKIAPFQQSKMDFFLLFDFESTIKLQRNVSNILFEIFSTENLTELNLLKCL